MVPSDARATARALTGAPVVGSIALMLLNDHFLKHAELLPGAVTGKLSDFAFLFFAPIVLAFLFRARTRVGLLICFGVPAMLLSAINLSPACSALFANAMSLLWPMKLWPDPTDLIALLSLPLAWRHLRSFDRPPKTTRGRRPRMVAQTVIAAVAAVSCLATSPPPMPVQPTHQPVYLSWEELRSTAVALLPPQPIGKRGKLMIAHGHLFLSEPGEGVHVFDNRDPRDPRPVFFIRIPGNVDIAIQDDLLFADSFVDLLTFKLDLERRSATLIGRLTDQFDYNPYQALPDAAPIYLGQVDRTRGVIVGAVPIDPAAPEDSHE